MKKKKEFRWWFPVLIAWSAGIFTQASIAIWTNLSADVGQAACYVVVSILFVVVCIYEWLRVQLENLDV